MEKPSRPVHAIAAFCSTAVLFSGIALFIKLIIWVPALIGALAIVAMFGAFWNELYSRMEEYNYE